jgi:hypothetical protein
MTPVLMDASSDSIDFGKSDPKRVKMYYKNKGGTGLKSIAHMAQLYVSEKF